MGKYIFISYDQSDFYVADKLRESFEADGIEVMTAKYGNVHSVIASCSAFVVVHTKHANTSKTMANELTIARSAFKSIIVVKADKSAFEGSMEYNLASIKYSAPMIKSIDVLTDIAKLDVMGVISPDEYKDRVEELKSSNEVARAHNRRLKWMTFGIQMFFMALLVAGFAFWQCVYGGETLFAGIAMSIFVGGWLNTASVLTPIAAFSFTAREWSRPLFTLSRILSLPGFLWLLCGILLLLTPTEEGDMLFGVGFFMSGLLQLTPYITFMFVKKIMIDEKRYVQSLKA